MTAWKAFVLILLAICLAYWCLPDDKLHTLKGKRVLVTGSSEGIGEQIAYHYARLGANVVVTARRAEKLNKVVKKCQTLSQSYDSKHFAVPADMSNMNDTKRVIEEATKHLGSVDILVINHVKLVHGKAFKGTPDDLVNLDADMNVNFRSYVHLAAHALPQLVTNEGNIVIVNSLAGKAPLVYYGAYSAAKHALNGFFHALRSQFAKHGQDVSVTSCYLGLIGTDHVMERLNRSKSSTLKDLVMVPACPADTALDIVRGAARRQSEVYSPYLNARIITVLYSFVPELTDYLIRLFQTFLDGYEF